MTNLPKLADLHYDVDVAFKNDSLKLLLNQEPHNTWVKKNPYANNAQYVPIDKIEFLLDRIFQDWQIEVRETKQLFNAIQVTVRVHYLHPIKNEWRYHDGVGAKELQTQKDSGPLKLDFSNVNKSAVEMATPIAKSMAIKDACDHLGKLFGRDLNRKDTVNFTGSFQQPKQEEQTNTINNLNQNFEL